MIMSISILKLKLTIMKKLIENPLLFYLIIMACVSFFTQVIQPTLKEHHCVYTPRDTFYSFTCNSVDNQK